MIRKARWIAGFAAVAGVVGLTLQFALIVGKLGPALGAWRFLGYFTILTNIGAALVASAIALGGQNKLAGARARLLAATSIIMVGLVYSIALRQLWSPTGLQKIADALLHDVVPVLFALLRAVSPHEKLRRADFWWALAPPALYAVYALVRGAVDGWYAYWFLDPSQQTLAALAASVTVMLCGFAVVAGMLVVLDRWLAARVGLATDTSA